MSHGCSSSRPLHRTLHQLRRKVALEEQPHEVVLEREVEFREARVALARAAAAQLPVDAPRLVALGADDVEPAEFADALAEFDVGAAARHVRRDRDRAALAGARDDVGLLLVELRVEHGVNHAGAPQMGQHLRGLDAHSAHEHGLPRLLAPRFPSRPPNLSRRVLKMESLGSTRMHGWFVGMTCTARR